jgi:hypothetical protein
MKTKTPKLIPILAVAGSMLTSCSSIRRDDHSSVYFYQHQAAPTRQVVETVTTNSTRTRRYAAQEEELPADSPGVSGLGSEPDFLQPPESNPGRGIQRYGR